jgi:hypothetical protein
MTESIKHIATILRLSERLFVNAFAGVSETQAAHRISDHNNPIVWIATHTVWARYNMAAMLCKPGTNPYQGLFENFKAYDASMQLPAIADIIAEWKKASLLLNEGLESVSEGHLGGDAPFKNPTGDFTIGGALAFLTQHESYDIGQLGFLKKFHTNEPMSYN